MIEHAMSQVAARRPENPERTARLFFVAGLCIYVFLQVGAIVTTIVERPSLPFLYDSYAYIAKAEQLTHCLFQDCPAVDDLHRQLMPRADDGFEATDQRTRQHHRVIYQYHLLHSAALALLGDAGLSGEHALAVLAVGGALLIAAGVAYFLYALWGWGAAGCGLFLLSTAVYPGFHGTHWIVPSNTALGIGLLAWAGLVDRRRWGETLLPFFILAMVWMHPVGRIYAMVALILHAVLFARRSRRSWPWLGAAALVAAVSVSVPLLVDVPSFRYEPPTPLEGWTVWQGIAENFDAAFALMGRWFDGPASLALVALAAVGFAGTPDVRRRTVYMTTGLLVAVVVVSLFYPIARYPAELFDRVVVPLAMLGGGAAGHGAWSWIAAVSRRGGPEAARSFWPLGKSGGRLAFLGLSLGAAMLLGSVWDRAVLGSEARRSKTHLMIAGYRRELDLSQPSRVLEQLSAGDRLAYMDQLSLYFYLSKGGLHHGVYYQPAIDPMTAGAAEAGWLSKVRYAVSEHPGFLAHVALRDDAPLELHFDREPLPERITLLIGNDGDAATIVLRDNSGAEGIRIKVATKNADWIGLTLPSSFAGSQLFIEDVGGGSGLVLKGLRLDPESRHHWPWDMGISLVRRQQAGDARKASSPEEPASVRLAGSLLIPPSCTSLGVLEDGGATVAIRVSCAASPNISDDAVDGGP